MGFILGQYMKPPYLTYTLQKRSCDGARIMPTYKSKGKEEAKSPFIYTKLNWRSTSLAWLRNSTILWKYQISHHFLDLFIAVILLYPTYRDSSFFIPHMKELSDSGPSTCEVQQIALKTIEKYKNDKESQILPYIYVPMSEGNPLIMGRSTRGPRSISIDHFASTRASWSLDPDPTWLFGVCCVEPHANHIDPFLVPVRSAP